MCLRELNPHSQVNREPGTTHLLDEVNVLADQVHDWRTQIEGNRPCPGGLCEGTGAALCAMPLFELGLPGPIVMALDPELAKMFDLAFFHENGFHRAACSKCGAMFWSLDAKAPDCGDSSCREYTFLGAPLSKKTLSMAEMRQAFRDFWATRGHTPVPRNPVVARWRDDLYLNIASIANYQPHVTSGDVKPPANPLVVSQPCIRLNDLSNIGRSGRHFSCFEMMGHHAFNSAEWGEHYWTEECVSGGHAFLTEVLGLEPESLTYVEDAWAGGGNAGPCFEVFAGGLEVATLVFMCLAETEPDDAGEAHIFEVKGGTYTMMDLRIIDTGWGLERLAWASTGTPTAYDTVFPEVLAKLRELATVAIGDDERSKRLVEMHSRVQGVLNLDIGMSLDGLREEVVERMAANGIETDAAELVRLMEPIEAMYGLADHLRCLSFMIGDGIVPGNVKAGYLMRLVFRRAFRYAETLGIDTPMPDLLAWNIEQMLGDFPEFEAAIGRAVEMTGLEHERYIESRDRGMRLVQRTLQKKKEISIDDLVEMYDTHGLGPNTVAAAAKEMGIHVDVPDTFDAIIAERHSQDKKTKAKRIVPTDVPLSERLFYDDDGQWDRTFDATIAWSGPADIQALGIAAKDGEFTIEVGGFHADVEPEHVKLVVLDRTCFFHETGGQPSDQGALIIGGKLASICKTLKDGDQVVHVVVDPEDAVKLGAKVTGTLDWELRMNHTRSHTATHIMNQSVRRVLGPHSWQAGTQKYADCARVDMSHYRRPTPDELANIESLANAIVMQGRPVLREWHTRDVAEAKWGMQLLQGGIPKGKSVRVVRIGPAAEDADEPETPFGAVANSDDFDVEYCGGTHCLSTTQVGPIKLWRTERVQDGVERFEYSAGQHAISRWQTDETTIREAAAAMGVSPNEVPQAARKFFDEWKERGKMLAELQSQLAELKAAAAAGDAEEINGVRIIVDATLDGGAMQKTAAELVAEPNTVALLAAPAGGQVRLLFGRSPDVNIDMGAVLREAASHVGGKGGGRPDFAQGAGNNAEGLDACMEAARAAVAKALG